MNGFCHIAPEERRMKIGIIGCGLIGQKRAGAIGADDRVVAVTDVLAERAEALARPRQARVYASAAELLDDASIEVVVIATPHNELANVALAAVERGKHVLLEKPGARRSAELEAVQVAAQSRQVSVHVGFNHRFHPALRKAKELIREGCVGPLFYIRGRYGHGGRIGYDREWRANPEISGGGELLDQGAHLIDLSAWYFGAPFTSIHGVMATYFWDMPVEDNAFLTLRTDAGLTAQLQVTWTEWKNLFSLEIVGRDAKLQIDGLGGSYGVERLSYYAMKPEMGPPDTTIWEYPGADRSWHDEWEHFRSEIKSGRIECEPGLSSTRAVLSVVEQVYRQNRASWVRP
jgi:predicted dehydrogenase